jgi:Leucine-rich repeat (LRR) protein
MNIKSVLALFFLGCLVVPQSRGDDAADALLASRTAFLNVHDTVQVTFERQHGTWRVAAVHPFAGRTALDIGKLVALPGLATVEFRGVIAQGMEELVELRSLRRLVAPRNLTESGLKAISRLPRLEDLDLSELKLPSEKFLAPLQNCGSLRRLDLEGVGLSDRSLLYLKSLNNIQELNLDGNSITDDGLATLTQLNTLRVLHLGGNSQITNAGVAKLKKLSELRVLSVSKLDPKGLAALVELPHLETLNIGSYLPGPGQGDLSGLKGLDSLSVFRQSARLRLPEDLKRLEVYDEETVAKLDFQSSRHLKSYVSLKLDSDDAQARDLEWLGRLPQLTELKLGGAVDQDLVAISRLSPLRALSLTSRCPDTFGDRGIKAISQLRQLESLKFEALTVTDAGMAVLDHLPALRHLEIEGMSNVTAEGLVHIWKMKQLRALRLDLSPELQRSIDDVFVDAAALAELEELSISGSVSNKGLTQLAALTNLRVLDLSRNDGYTDSGLGALMSALPNLQVVIRTYRVRSGTGR